ncbi:hypothetical protein ACLB2K_062499 [Fragaria x ananassa]
MNGLYIRPARWPAPMTVSSIPWHLDAATVSVSILAAPHLVSISNKYIYAYSKGARSNTLVRFDLEKKEWECLYRNFWGRLAPEVVLYGDSYLSAAFSISPIFRHDRGTDTPVTAATDRERERLCCRVGAGGGEGLGGSGLVGAPGWLNCLRALFGLAHGVVRGDGGGSDAVT